MKVSNCKRASIIAMIPVRMGSTRLPKKNLALLNGKPLIHYAIQVAKDAGVFKRVVINSESVLFARMAKRYGVDFYKRPNHLATSYAKSDSVVYDFVKNNPGDIVAWINPTSPLQSGNEIKKVVKYFIDNRLDSLITVKNEPVHCVYKRKPVNFKIDGLFSRTQDLEPVQSFVYSVMIWRAEVFKRTFERIGHAFFCGKVGFYPVSKLNSVIIKRKEDLMLAEFLLKLRDKNQIYEVKYDKIVKEVNKHKDKDIWAI